VGGENGGTGVISQSREMGGIAMLKQFNTRLRDKAVITAAILSVFGHDVAVADPLKFGGSNNYNNTTSPIKHVIVETRPDREQPSVEKNHRYLRKSGRELFVHAAICDLH
jgi:hypothetical protein